MITVELIGGPKDGELITIHDSASIELRFPFLPSVPVKALSEDIPVSSNIRYLVYRWSRSRSPRRLGFEFIGYA